jgi:hypothetical protein
MSPAGSPLLRSRLLIVAAMIAVDMVSVGNGEVRLVDHGMPV